MTDTTNSTNTTTSSSASNDDFFKENLSYIIGGVAIGCILVALVVAVVLWRKHPKRLKRCDVEAHEDRDGVYVEVAEQTSKRKRKKKPSRDVNPVQGIELVAFDTAPDIITAHDSDSIYETLDGRRAARARAGQVTPQNNQAGGIAVPVPATTDANVCDPTYDHLSRYPHRKAQLPLDERPGKRCTDPEVIRRQKTELQIYREVQSADEYMQTRHKGEKLPPTTNVGDNNNDTRAMGTCDSCNRKNSPSASMQSSVTGMGEKSSAGGKKILCQLTMVGVVENGKPVPTPRRRANNAYFVLEPGSQVAALGEEESFQRLKGCKAKFQVNTEAGGGRSKDAGGSGAGAGSSEYFVLQPLDQGEQEDLSDLTKTLSSPSLLKQEEEPTSPRISRRFSVHGHRSISSFAELSQDADSDNRHSVVFRSTRLHSCPEASPSRESSTRDSVEYQRSLSSPRCSHLERPEEDGCSGERKVDANWLLKARIQREMRVLGFLSDTEPGSSNDYSTAVVESDSESDTEMQSPEGSPLPGPRPPRNEYFILEPEQETCDSHDDDNDDDIDDDNNDGKIQPIDIPATPPAFSKAPTPKPRTKFPQAPALTNSSNDRPRYQRQYTAPQGLPPRLPHRNPTVAHHTRSRSETPFFKPSFTSLSSNAMGDEDEGPVVVSLKKSKSADTSNAAGAGATGAAGSAGAGVLATAGVTTRGVERRESLRPRIKSAHSVLS
ncbi:uncharacterized protein [Littorina saxatilis]|uniref:Uncharacterized protein n=1 Tax=Littorina saxatilis TaxID=31220 RepID=A0AAN9GD80_9CAEN